MANKKIKRIQLGTTDYDIQATDTNVVLDSDLKTYYNVGKITTASGINPVTIGKEGESLRTVFTNLFSMDEVQPAITQPPSVSCSLSSNASDERGTEIKSVSYSISFDDGAYTNANTTGVKMTNYSFGNGVRTEAIKGDASASGTLILPSSFIVGESPSFSTTLTASYSQGNIAKTNLGNDSSPVVRIQAGTVDASPAPSFAKIAVDYPYYISSNAATIAALSGKSLVKKSNNLVNTTGLSCSYSGSAYVWIFVRKGSTTVQPSKTIQAYSDIAKEWGTFLGGTELMGTITFNKANGVEDTFFAYRTTNTAGAGDSATFRLN